MVRTLTMGQSQGHNIPPLSAPVNIDAPPLRFHRSSHGENIVIEHEGFRAKRFESFCKGIVFSDRPVAIHERVAIRLTDLSSRWSGVLRVGFTNHDPGMLGHLPKYACPDLTSRPGFWAKALSERYSESNVLIHYFIGSNGDVHFGINGQDRGVFFTGVDMRRPVWAMIDLYGNCTGIEMIDLRAGLNNFSNSERHNVRSSNSRDAVVPQNQDPNVQLINGQLANWNLSDQRQPQQPARQYTLPRPPAPLPHPPIVHQQQQQPNHSQPPQPISQHNVEPPPPPPPPVAAAGAVPPTSHQVNPNFRPLKYNQHVAFRPLAFHHSTGKNVKLNENSMVAYRTEEEFSQGYVFSAHPVKLGERIVVQVLDTEDSYIGYLAFGLTNCDPSLVDTRELPEDSDMLLDRPEYWVVSKDVGSSPQVGDELSFHIRLDGSVEFSKNGQPPTVFMHVDTSLRLFAFWDVYGNTSKIRIMGSTCDPIQRLTSDAPINEPLVGVHLPNGEIPNGLGECTVCYERAVDCAIYTCGHMCMCHQCALQQWKGRGGGFCPICREPIKDVIRTFRA